MKSSSYSNIVSIVASIGGLLFGFEIGVVNQIFELPAFQKYFNISPHDEAKVVFNSTTGDIVMAFLLGCMLGSFLLIFISDAIGRKRSLWLGSFLFAVGGLLQALAINLWCLLSGRILSGLGVGILSVIVPLYISEVSIARIRGRMTTINQLMIAIGIALANVVNILLRTCVESSEKQWRIAFAVQCIPAIILFISTFLLPHSPRWLLLRNRPVEALDVLARLRGETKTSGMVQREFWQIKESIDDEMCGNRFLKILKPGILNRIVIACCLHGFQQWSGINALMYYSSRLFKMLNFDANTGAVIHTVITSLVNVSGTLPGLYFIEKAGRRNCLIVGGIIMSVCMWGLVATFSVQPENFAIEGIQKVDPAPFYVGLAGSICIYLYTFSYAATWGPVVWVYQSEVFPLDVRGIGTALATLTNWGNNVILAKILPFVVTWLSGHLFIIFGITTFLSVLFVKYFVVETKGCTLEEIGYLFTAGVGGKIGLHEENTRSSVSNEFSFSFSNFFSRTPKRKPKSSLTFELCSPTTHQISIGRVRRLSTSIPPSPILLSHNRTHYTPPASANQLRVSLYPSYASISRPLPDTSPSLAAPTRYEIPLTHTIKAGPGCNFPTRF